MIGAHLKIFLNYSQTITIINSLNLNWGQFLTGFFDIQKTVSGGAVQVLILECFIHGSIFFNFIININFQRFYFTTF